MANCLCRIFNTVRTSRVRLFNRLNRSIMTTSPKAKKFLEGLKDNPYFDKYAAAFAKLQLTNPDEFSAKIEENEGKKNAEKKVPGFFLRKTGFFHGRKKITDINRIRGRNFCNYSTNSVYITTPIFYVNAGPHIGHLYTAALADTLARYNSMLGHEVFLNTGTDEHGNKVRNSAVNNNLEPLKYCDKISGLFKDMCDTFDVNYTKFIRTTDVEHQQTVHHFWNTLANSGHIYLGKYSGWYCTADEAFVSESELQEKKLKSGESIKISSASGHPVEWMEEENYKFRLSSFQNDLKHWLKDDGVVKPAKYYKILSSWIEEGSCLEDLSISRASSRAPWGVKVPQDNSHTIYVWLDALVNYLTALGYPSDKKFSKFWPPSLQVIGKDILKFHAVYWPAFLIAAKLEPPKTLLCHSHWTVNDEKMSKSKGNVVSPFDAAQIFTPNGLRYFLLREAVPHDDANYRDEKVRLILNSELADTLGNLVSRCMGKSVNPYKKIPEPLDDHPKILNSLVAHNLVENLHQLHSQAENHYAEFNLHKLVDCVMQSLFLANKLVDHHKPWLLAREKLTGNEDSAEIMEAVLALSLETARISSLILYPIIPRLCSELLDFLNVPGTARKWENCRYGNSGRKNDEIEDEDVKQMKFAFFRKLN